MASNILYLPKPAGGEKMYYVSGRDIRNYRKPRISQPHPCFNSWVLMDALDKFCDVDSIPKDVFYIAAFNSEMKMTSFEELRLFKQEHLENTAGIIIAKRKESFGEDDAEFYKLAEKSYGHGCNFDYIVIKRRMPFSMKKYVRRRDFCD